MTGQASRCARPFRKSERATAASCGCASADVATYSSHQQLIALHYPGLQAFSMIAFAGQCSVDLATRFALRTIAESSELKCPSCGSTICLGNGDYEPLLRDVKHTLQDIDSASLAAAAVIHCI
jgi:hypothetical protein